MFADFLTRAARQMPTLMAREQARAAAQHERDLLALHAVRRRQEYAWLRAAVQRRRRWRRALRLLRLR